MQPEAAPARARTVASVLGEIVWLLTQSARHKTLLLSDLETVAFRIVPCIMLLYFIADIDRVNIGFAALTMTKDLGFSPEVFGFGAGIFFWGYVLFEVPSNIILEKVGARLSIPLDRPRHDHMGIISAMFAFVGDTNSFDVLRVLRGPPKQASSPASSCV